MDNIEGKKLLFVRICGTGMSSLALMSRDLGADIRGVDLAFYPPISDILEREHIPTDSLDALQQIVSTWKPDALIIGNALFGKSKEAAFVLSCGIPYYSMPSFIEHFLLPGKQSLVVAGTHGKTTTTTIIAELLESLDDAPSYMIGGVPNFSGIQSVYRKEGRYIVLEGDEYDTAFFDKEPKFLHYRPDITIVTSIEFDHADIYHSVEHIFRKFVSLSEITAKKMIISADFPKNRELIDMLPPEKRITYSIHSSDADCVITDTYQVGLLQGFTARFADGFECTAEIPLIGEQNLMNVLAALAVLHEEGILQSRTDDIVSSLRQLRGVKRRQEFLGLLNGAPLYSDFAHHPTAMKYTLDGFFNHFPSKKICTVFDPATNTNGQNVFEKEYQEILQRCDAVFIGFPPKRERFPEEKQFSPERICSAINKNGEEKAFYIPDVDQLIRHLISLVSEEWVVIVMSNSGFSGFFEKISAHLTNAGER